MKKFSKPSQDYLRCGRFKLNLESPLIMGILNVTPDSFSDGGHFINVDSALKQAKAMIANGADIIDIGGESTRPGASDVSIDEELERVIPLIEVLVKEIDIPISIDTSKALVMSEAVNAGASMINDVYALRQDGALQTAAELNVPVCLMHMQGVPRSMQKNIKYENVTSDVLVFLHERIDACYKAGIEYDQIIIDPGFGFGKLLEHNLGLLNDLDRFVDTGFPVLAGLSRKSMLGQITGNAVHDRLAGSLAAAQIAMQKGVQIVRVHDVPQTKDVRDVLVAVQNNINNYK